MSTNTLSTLVNAENVVIETFTGITYTNQGNGGTTLNMADLAGVSSTDDVIALTRNMDPQGGDLTSSEILTIEVNSVTDNGVEIIARVIDADATTPAWAEVANNTAIEDITIIAVGN